jgi:hypothetical protein
MTAVIQNYNRQSVSLRDPDGGGRPPVIPTPDIQPSPEWLDAWMGCELELMMLGRSKHTAYQRKSQVLVLARHAGADGLGPAEITKMWMHERNPQAEVGGDTCRPRPGARAGQGDPGCRAPARATTGSVTAPS